MADLVFFGFAEFGEGAVETVGDKKRVVTKAGGSARFDEDSTFACAFKEFDLKLSLICVTDR